MSYGIPYQGSKSRIAEWVVGVLPAAPVLVDLFAGGCAVTHAALLSGKWGRVIANDLTEAPEIFRDACAGEFEGYATVPDRAEFNDRKGEDDALALLYSFGNNRTDYLWSRELEPVKVAASRMLTAPSVRERRMAYRDFIGALGEYMDDRGGWNAEPVESMEGVERLGRLQGLDALGRLQGLDALGRLQGLDVTRRDYRAVEIPDGATVYADPPYRNTNCKAYEDGFDFAAFDAWLAAAPHPVFVSEYTAPAGCVEIAQRNRQGNMAANGKGSNTVERIFVQERFAADFKTTLF